MKTLVALSLLFAVAIANPTVQERANNNNNALSSMTEQVAKQAIVQTAKTLAEQAVDTAANIYHWASDTGKAFGNNNAESGHGKQAVQSKKFGKSKRSPNPIIDELLKKRLDSTFDELDHILSTKRTARQEGSQALSILTSVVSTVLSMLKNIPALAPIIEMIKPFLAILGINM